MMESRKSDLSLASSHQEQERLIVVAIGASAGGLEPCRQLIKTLPSGNICYIFCQHLSPHHNSLLKEILLRETELTVLEMTDHQALKRNHFYVPEPNKNIEVVNGHLVLSAPDPNHLPKPNVDKLLTSLAVDKRERSVAVVLSGSGSDGAKGIVEIKNCGGVVLVQDPESCQYDSMPRAALSTHIVDFVGNPEGLAECLQRLLLENPFPKDLFEKNQTKREWITKRVFDVTGVDFSGYRDNTIQRRLARRMQMLNVSHIDDYVKRLKESEQEVWQLMQSTFVVVSEFYRDADNFTALTKFIEDMLQQKEDHGNVRIWVPGCATGEEAYTLAMIVEDIIAKKGKSIQYKILATDLSQQALSVARDAIYEDDKLKNISNEWRDKFFNETVDKWQVKSFIREKTIFSLHDVLSDPPFSRLDMVSCRNLMIYFNDETKTSIFKTFAYSLNPKGILFLGASENCSEKGFFLGVDEAHKVYQRSEYAKKEFVVGKSHPNLQKSPFPLGKAKVDHQQAFLYETLFQQFSPPLLIVDDNNNLVFKSGAYQYLLDDASGFVDENLFARAYSELRPKLRALLFKSRKNNELVKGLVETVMNDGAVVKYTVSVKPVGSNFLGWFIIFCSESKVISADQQDVVPNEDLLVKELNDELSETRENLQILIEELESTNEQLQVYNEELQSSNEEYQSTNEELQTVNEELQSTNEELITVNEEYALQSLLYQRLTSDLNNIQESVGFPLILINKDYRIKRFTSNCSKIVDTASIKEGDLIFALEWYCDIQLLKPLIEEVDESKNIVKKEMIISDEYYDCQVSPYVNGNDEFEGYTVIFYQTNEFKNIQETLTEEKIIAQRTLETIRDGVIRLGGDLSIQYANSLSAELSGWSLDVMQGEPISRVLKLYHDNVEYPLEKKLQEAIDQQKSVHFTDQTLQLKTRRGKDIYIELSFSPIMLHDSEKSSGGVIAFRDVSERFEQMQTLLWSSTHDGLTGLINRKEIERRLDTAIITAKRNQINSTLLYMDLDQFKIVNDTCGHQAGDLLLKQLSKLMMDMLRSRDTLARLGGDEFALLLEKCPLLEAESIALKLQQSISNYRFIWEEKIFNVGVSIGVVEIDAEANQVSELLKNADAACYLAKESGRNRVQIHTDNNDALETNRLQMRSVSDINEAMENNGFRLYFQEIVSTDAMIPNRWEVLLRMYKKQGSFLLPETFLPAAERFGLIANIDLWVLSESLTKVGELVEINESEFPYLNINISGATMGNENYLTKLAELIKKHKIDPFRLCFELTETVAMSHYVEAKIFIEKIRRIGCRFALDDFGRGTSSLSHLRDLPLDVVKIDSSFVENIINDDVKTVIVKSVKDVAALLNLQVITEGVEDIEQLKHLESLGIHLMQGFI